MRKYIDYKEFYDKLVNHLPENETWRLDCESDDDCIYRLVFTKHLYEAENGAMYPFIVYSYPKTLDAGLIQEDIDNGWDEAIENVWINITEICNLEPFIEYD